MIMHFDMASGEVVYDQGRSDTVSDPVAHSGLALRLQRVDETIKIDRRAGALPAEVVLAPVAELLRRGD